MDSLFKTRELTPEEKQRAKEKKKRDMPNVAQMLDSIVEWKLDRLRKELTTPGAIPWLQMKEAEIWPSANCPLLFQYAPRLESAGLIERKPNGFNVKCQQASFAVLMSKCGFQRWSDIGKYFKIKGKKANGNSLKNQANPGKYPAEWNKIAAAIPELKQ